MCLLSHKMLILHEIFFLIYTPYIHTWLRQSGTKIYDFLIILQLGLFIFIFKINFYAEFIFFFTVELGFKINYKIKVSIQAFY